MLISTHLAMPNNIRLCTKFEKNMYCIREGHFYFLIKNHRLIRFIFKYKTLYLQFNEERNKNFRNSNNHYLIRVSCITFLENRVKWAFLTASISSWNLMIYQMWFIEFLLTHIFLLLGTKFAHFYQLVIKISEWVSLSGIQFKFGV